MLNHIWQILLGIYVFIAVAVFLALLSMGERFVGALIFLPLAWPIVLVTSWLSL